LNPLIAVNLAKPERANFSHALEAKVKKIMENLACAPIGRRWIGFPEDDVNQSPKAQISGGEAAVTLPMR
jgi:hypothetical protein